MATGEGNASGTTRLFTRIGKPRVPGGPEEHENDVAILKEALADAIAQAKAHGCNTVWYLNNSTKDFRSPFHVEVHGTDVLDAMETDTGAEIDGIAVKRAQASDLLAQRLSCVIFAVYPDPVMLDRIDHLLERHGVVVVPWTDHPEPWNAKWRAVPI